MVRFFLILGFLASAVTGLAPSQRTPLKASLKIKVPTPTLAALSTAALPALAHADDYQSLFSRVRPPPRACGPRFAPP